MPPPSTTARGRTPDLSPEMTKAQEDFLRSGVAQMIDPATGVINTTKAALFLRDNAPMLERFPQLRQQVQDALAAQRGAADAGQTAKANLADAEKTATTQLREQTAEANTAAREQGSVISGAEQRLNQQSAFARVLKAGEQPQRAVASALSGPNPSADYEGLARLARQAGPEAEAGLRAATFDHIQSLAAKGDTVSFKALAEALFTPMGNSGLDLMAQLRQSGIVTTTQAQRIRQVVQRGLQHEGSTAIARAPADVVDGVGDTFDFLLRVVGANYGSGVSVIGSNSGAPLVAAQAGSKLARKLGEKIPAQRVKDIMFKAMEDEELLKTLLTKIDSPRAEARVMKQLDAALFSAGVGYANDRENINGPK
jgi:hypothetical protein